MQNIHFSGSVQGAKLSFLSQPSLSFKVGEVVEGQVLQALSSTTVMIQLKNTVIEARTEIPLQVGALARFEVVSTEGEIRLKRLPSLTKPESLLVQALQNLKGNTRPVSEIYRAFSQLTNLPEAIQKRLPDLSVLNQFMQGVDVLSGEQLKALIESSGVIFENKLKRHILKADSDSRDAQDLEKERAKIFQSDLKGTLLKIKSRLQEQSLLDLLVQHKIKPEALIEAIETLLSEVTTQQLQSKLEQTVQLFLPFFWKGLKDGRMIFRQSKGEASLPLEKRHCFCSVHLELEKAGKITAQVQMISGQFHLQLVSENTHFATLLRERLDALKAQFNKAGLKWGDLSVRHQQEIDFELDVTDGIDIKV